MDFESLFDIEKKTLIGTEHIIKCQRCKHFKPIQSFWQGDKNFKLCYDCREYNKKYLKLHIEDTLQAKACIGEHTLQAKACIVEQNNLRCHRCRKKRNIEDFFNKTLRLKLCFVCRNYNKKQNN